MQYETRYSDIAGAKAPTNTQTRNNVISQSSLSIEGLHWRVGPTFARPDTLRLSLGILDYSCPNVLQYYREVKHVWGFLLYIKALRTCSRYQRYPLGVSLTSSSRSMITYPMICHAVCESLRFECCVTS